MVERKLGPVAARRAPRVVVERLRVRFAPGSATLADARGAARHAAADVSSPNGRARGPGAELGGRIAEAVRQAVATARGGKHG